MRPTRRFLPPVLATGLLLAVPVPVHAQSVPTITVRELEARIDVVRLLTLSDGGFVDVPERVVEVQSDEESLTNGIGLLGLSRGVSCDNLAVCTIYETFGTPFVGLGIKWRTVVAQAPGSPLACVRIVHRRYGVLQNRVVGCGKPAPGMTRYWFLDAPPRLIVTCFFCNPESTRVEPRPTERGWACESVPLGSGWLAGCTAR